MAAGNLNISETLIAEIQRAAAAEHRRPEQVLEDAMKLYTEERSWTKLLTYGQQRAKELGTTEADIDRAIRQTRAEERDH